jgi:hypothetical protein
MNVEIFFGRIESKGVLSSHWSVLQSTCVGLLKIDPTLNLKESVSVLYALVCQLRSWTVRFRAMETPEGARRIPPCLAGGQ